MEKMHKLALDPSKKFGWCLHLDIDLLPERAEPYKREDQLFYGTWDLEKDIDGKKCCLRGQFAWNLWENFNALRRERGIEEDELQIILEGESYGSQKSEAGRRMAAMWLVVLEMMCVRKKLPPPITCPVDSWRESFIKCTRAPKEVGAGLKDDAARTEARRKWLKDKVMRVCSERGLHPKNDNEADALGIMFWALVGGIDALESSRRKKKEQRLTKTRQKKLDLAVAA
ncbi:hypothetical protein HQ945_08500 [Phyllobacterium sp. BT25]|uniref:Uncharacterized protein n=1 Tax=Phyllobacterium pellucidum TaxID=2740464 RepID=A0A849VQL7_9HYPH|nr:hypothetical protein [Phyllobacterium pellucidum]NTS31294.1 hypothetical protein [Phyllobacterium pellucidum]